MFSVDLLCVSSTVSVSLSFVFYSLFCVVFALMAFICYPSSVRHLPQI